MIDMLLLLANHGCCDASSGTAIDDNVWMVDVVVVFA